MRSLVRWSAVALALACRVASAQEMGLDLTEVGDFRGTLAILGLAVVDPELPPDTFDRLKLDKIGGDLPTVAEEGGLFAKVTNPSEVLEAMPSNYGDALKCGEAACFRSAAETLNVNFVVVGQVLKSGGKTLLRFWRFTRFSDSLDRIDVPAERGPKLLERDGLSGYRTLLKALATQPMGILSIKCLNEGARAAVDGRPVGPVPTKVALPPGSYRVKVEAEGFVTREQETSVKASETAEVEINLPAKPVAGTRPSAAPEVTSSASGPFWKRPGTYVAAAGVAAIIAGIAFGQYAKGVEARAVDKNGDGWLDIGRREAIYARDSATTANVLVGVGSAAVVGGGVWLFLAPKAKAGTSAPVGPSEKDLDGPQGWTWGIGVSGVLP